MHPLLQRTAAFAAVGLLVAPAVQAQHTAMPAGMTHEQHMAQMKKDAGMKECGTISKGGGDHRPGEAMKGREADTSVMAEMSVIHELFMSHARITRTVTNLPDGVRTVTASDDPRIADLLKGHVARMNALVDTGRDPNLPMESPALRTLFRKFATIRTSSDVTATGVVVTQTSSDPETVAALQQHASEVTTFVDQGMAAMHDAMMKSRQN